jgi:hypothetical protein
MEWIKVTDRLPGDGDHVLITNGHYVTSAVFRHWEQGEDTWECDVASGAEFTWGPDYSPPTHWAPLPERPKRIVVKTAACGTTESLLEVKP